MSVSIASWRAPRAPPRVPQARAATPEHRLHALDRSQPTVLHRTALSWEFAPPSIVLLVDGCDPVLSRTGSSLLIFIYKWSVRSPRIEHFSH